MNDLWGDYLQHLIWRGNLQKFSKYSKLFEILHRIEFTWIIDRDDNREADGIDLREDYNIPIEYTNEECNNFMNHWCSVLEMMIGLAIRVDYEIIGDPSEEHPEHFFMKMIRNLDLLRLKEERTIIKIVNIWLNREFERNGRGSPFPVRNDRRDQRKLEIWDQMNSYISENYI